MSVVSRVRGGSDVVDHERPKIESIAAEKHFATSRGAPVHALGPADFVVGQGEFVTLLGPSGCGKSTLLRLVAGLQRPTAGEIVIHQSDPSSALLAVVFQDYSIFQWKTVLENVRFGLDLARVPRSEGNERSHRWLDRLGLSDFASHYPSTLSGGMRQRVSIARALAIEPEILLMDEPFAALDPQLRTVLQDELLNLWQADQRTVLFVTHSMEEALVLSDRILVMGARPGRIVAEYHVPFARPRGGDVRGSAEFAGLQAEIWEVLRQEVVTTYGTQERS